MMGTVRRAAENQKGTGPMADSRSKQEGWSPVAELGEEPTRLLSSGFVARATLQVVLVMLGVAVALWMLYRLQGLLFLLVLAVFFAYLVTPFVGFFCRRVPVRGRKVVLPRPVAIGVVYLLLFGSLAAVFVLLLPVLNRQLDELATEAPGYFARLQGRWLTWQKGYDSRSLPPAVREAVDRAIHQAVTAGGTYVTSELLPRLAGWLVYLPWLILVPILAFFLLKDGGFLRQSALRILPPGDLRSRGDVFLLKLNDTLAAYIRAQVTACLLIGVVCTIAFLVIGVPYAVVLGIAAGLLEFIPLAGPLTIGVLATSFAAFHSLGQAAAVLIFLLVLRAVQDYIVYPRIIGTGIQLHPLVVILAILCGAELGGLAGIFLAIPVVAVLTLAYWHYRDHRAAEAQSGSP
jgi:predicted PurR-regulated permease PerM